MLPASPPPARCEAGPAISHAPKTIAQTSVFIVQFLHLFSSINTTFSVFSFQRIEKKRCTPSQAAALEHKLSFRQALLASATHNQTGKSQQRQCSRGWLRNSGCNRGCIRLGDTNGRLCIRHGCCSRIGKCSKVK